MPSSWMAAVMPAIVLTSGYRGSLEAIGQFALVNAIRVPMGIYTFLAPMTVVWAGYRDLVVISAVLALGRLIACLLHAWFALRAIEEVRRFGRLDRRFIKPLLQFGGWLSVMNTFGPLIGYVDRFIVGMTLGPQAVTYFVTPQEVANKISLIPMAISTAAFPTLSRLPGANRRKSCWQRLRGSARRMPPLQPYPRSSWRSSLISFFRNGLAPILLTRRPSTLRCSPSAISSILWAMYRSASSWRSKAARQCRFCILVEGISYVLAIYVAGKSFGLPAVAFVWLVRIVIDTAIIIAMSIHFARRHQPHA